MSRCPTGKVRYRDEVAAMLALGRASSRSEVRPNRVEQRQYRCPMCKGWHLTSQKRKASR